jgi:hypothetical protein
MSMPEAMQEIGRRMENLQENTEVRLRPLLAKQFRSMADCMETGGNPESVQNCMKTAQSRVVDVQNQLDRVVSTFGEAMQKGMGKCQADAQQLMANGGRETGKKILLFGFFNYCGVCI